MREFGSAIFEIPALSQIVVFSFAIGIPCGIIAFSRGRLPIAWFCLGCLFNVFALVLVLALPSLQRAKSPPLRGMIKVEPPKVCLYCGGYNSQAFRYCVQCGEPFNRSAVIVEVHHFKVWNNRLGDWEIPDMKRTAKAIGDVNGVIIEGTMERVFESDLDSHGRIFPRMEISTLPNRLVESNR